MIQGELKNNMQTEIQYCIDAKGNKISVIIPYQDWEKLNNRDEFLQKKVRLLDGIQDAVKEVKEARKNGKKLQTLSEFINENRG